MIELHPLDRYPVEASRWPKRSQFTATWAQTVELLEREANAVRSKRQENDPVFVYVDAAPDAFTARHALRSGGKVRSHGVVVEFDAKDGLLRFPCDAFNKSAWARDRNEPWKDNVRAVALALQHLRRVDDYGLAAGRQYTPWSALPSGRTTPDSPTSREQALTVLFKLAYPDADAAALPGLVARAGTADPGELRAVTRDAARRAHPDTGGTAELFAVYQTAKEMILP